MDLTDDVVQQLRAKAKLLRSIADQLAAGEHLQSAVTKARDSAVWTGPPQTAFCAWLDDLDQWVREQLAPGTGKVAEEIDRHASDLEDAQRKLNSAVPGTACPAPARRVRWSPARAPEFVLQVDRADGAVSMAPPEMEGLVALLGHAKDAYYAVGRQLDEALTPPRYVVTLGSGPAASPSPLGTQVAAQLSPQDHIPPDAADACGLPVILPQALGLQLDRAMQDVLDRARKWAQAASADSADNPGGLFGWIGGLGAILAKAQAVAVPTTAEVSRRQGADDAARFAALALPKAGDCPGHDDLSRIVGEVRAKAGGNPAYAAGFSAALGDMHYNEYGVDAGNGFEWFVRKVEVCGTGGHTHEQRWDDLHRSIAELFALATHDPSFDIRLAESMADSWHGGNSYLMAGSLRTDVALMVADHWIKAKDWRKKFPPPRDIAAGLKVLTANPEAAHIYALAHADLLTKGTNPDLLGTDMSGFDDTAAFAAEVLRIGLIEYPPQLAAAARDQRAVFSGAEAMAAAEDARRKAHTAMGQAIDALSSGAKPGPEGRLVLASFVGTHISDMGKALTSDRDRPELREDDFLKAHKKGAKAALKTITADPAARQVLLEGATQAVASWSTDLASRVGANLGKDPQEKVYDSIASESRFGEVEGPGARLGAFYGELGKAIMENADDAKEDAAQAAGLLSFFVSNVAGGVAEAVGGALGGGVAGIAAAYGADQLGKAVDSYIKQAQEEFAQTRDVNQVKAKFMELVAIAMEQTTSVSLWADKGIRLRLLAGDADRHAGAKPPPAMYGGKMITPPLEDPPGHLRVPAPDDLPAYDAFYVWWESPHSEPLRAAAAAALHNSGMLETFDRTLLGGVVNR